jgi:hypothetical protein
MVVARKHQRPSETTVAEGARCWAAKIATSSLVRGCGRKQAATVRPWAKWTEPVAGQEGIFYDVSIYLRGSRRRYFDYQNWLENTRRLHKHVGHICLEDQADSIRVTVPAVLGEQRVIEVLDHMIDMAQSSARPGEWPNYKGTIKNVADEWPEYVGTATPADAAHPRHALLDFRGLTDPRVGVIHRVGRSLRERRGPPATVDNALSIRFSRSVKT